MHVLVLCDDYHHPARVAREGLAPLLFASVGLSNEQAVALTLLVFAIERISGFLGAPIYIIDTLQRSRQKSAESV